MCEKLLINGMLPLPLAALLLGKLRWLVFMRGGATTLSWVLNQQFVNLNALSWWESLMEVIFLARNWGVASSLLSCSCIQRKGHKFDKIFFRYIAYYLVLVRLWPWLSFLCLCDSRLEILESVGSKPVKPTVGCGELCAQTLLSFSVQKPVYLRTTEKTLRVSRTGKVIILGLCVNSVWILEAIIFWK